MKIKHLFSAVLLFVGVSATAQTTQPIPVDPALRTGKLDNGLTYYIRHNDYPEKVASFYIAQKVGSVQENDDQRGLAHFLEHMAFNGSKHFKGNELLRWCEMDVTSMHTPQPTRRSMILKMYLQLASQPSTRVC